MGDLVESFKSSIGTNLQSKYTQVHVLLIAWADNDLGDVEQEIHDLRAVFEADYKYSSVSRFQIPVDGSQRRRLNSEISSFVEKESQNSNSLIVVYYAGHCSADDQGQAEWAAFEKGGPVLSWHVTQQILFSAQGDVLLILDCCNASLIAKGANEDGGRFELIAASAKGAKTPVPGRRSFTRALTRLLKQHAEKGVSSESLTSHLREDFRVTGKASKLDHPSPMPLGTTSTHKIKIGRDTRLPRLCAEVFHENLASAPTTSGAVGQVHPKAHWLHPVQGIAVG